MRSELIAAVTKRQEGLKARDVDLMIRSAIEVMTQAINQGREIELRGFGAFRQRRYDPRAARNPATGQLVELAGRAKILFRPGRELKERLQEHQTQAMGEPPRSEEKTDDSPGI